MSKINVSGSWLTGRLSFPFLSRRPVAAVRSVRDCTVLRDSTDLSPGLTVRGCTLRRCPVRCGPGFTAGGGRGEDAVRGGGGAGPGQGDGGVG